MSEAWGCVSLRIGPISPLEFEGGEACRQLEYQTETWKLIPLRDVQQRVENEERLPWPKNERDRFTLTNHCPCLGLEGWLISIGRKHEREREKG